MTAQIISVSGEEAWDLIFEAHLSKLSSMDQETMYRTLQNSSRVWLGIEDDQILALWGLIPPTFLSDRAYLWMYHTPALQEHVFVFIRHSQRVVQEMLQYYPRLFGHAKIGNSRAIRWLRWLGAQFSEPTGDFIPFEIKASQWQQPSVQSA